MPKLITVSGCKKCPFLRGDEFIDTCDLDGNKRAIGVSLHGEEIVIQTPEWCELKKHDVTISVGDPKIFWRPNAFKATFKKL